MKKKKLKRLKAAEKSIADKKARTAKPKVTE